MGVKTSFKDSNDKHRGERFTQRKIDGGSRAKTQSPDFPGAAIPLLLELSES